MSIDVLIQGRLRGSVTTKTAKNGNAFATFKLAAADKAGESLLCSCIAFSATAVETVQRLNDGDSIAVSGEAAVSSWQGRDGSARHGLDVTVHAALTAYHVARKRADKPKPQDDDFGDFYPEAL